MLFQELVASSGLYVLLPLDKIKVFAPNLNSGKSNELRKFVYQSCFFQSLFPIIVHFFSQFFQRLPQLCLCCCFSCSNLYSTIINNWSLLPPIPTEYVYIAKEKIKLPHNQLFKSSLLLKDWLSFSRLYDQLLWKTALLDILIWLVGSQNGRIFTYNWKFQVLRGSSHVPTPPTLVGQECRRGFPVVWSKSTSAIIVLTYHMHYSQGTPKPVSDCPGRVDI